MIVVENQSVLDAIIQNYGTLEAAVNFCLQNEISLTEDLQAYAELLTPIDENKKVEIANEISKKEFQFATGFPLIEEEKIGIGVMVIEQTFIVT